MSVTHLLASFAAETAPDALTASVHAQSYRLVLDTLGVAIGAIRLGPAQSLVAEVASWGGVPEASIWGTGHRTSAVQAAYVNAYLANVLDADETLLNQVHIANCIVAGALAVAERVGASGRELLNAVAIGYEVAARIGTSYRTWTMVDGRPDWSMVTGYSWVVFGVTAAAGRLIGLRPDQMASAFGIAGYSTPIPSIGKWVDSTRLPNTKYVFLGPLAHAGVASTLLAAQDFTGDDDVLDGDRGFWRMAGSEACDWAAMTRDLGTHWLLDEVSYKRYPACRFIHGPLDLLGHILASKQLAPDEIDQVVVQLPPAATRPYFVNPNPADVVEGSFSVPHVFACLAHGLPIGPAWHTAESLSRPDLARFRQRVEVAIDPRSADVIADQVTTGAGASYYRRCPTSLCVVARGQTFEASAEYASGDPWTPETYLSDAALEEKFLGYTSGAFGPEWSLAALASIKQLPTVTDVGNLRIFEPGPALSTAWSESFVAAGPR